jgi:GH24 family phage-related lysozyme (muramidase)
MGIFDPKVESTIAPERAVVEPSVALTGLTSLAGVLASAATSQKPAKPSAADVKEENNLQFLRDLTIKIPQIEDPAQRRKAERALFTRAAAAGVDEDFMQDAYSNVTGNVGEMGYTLEETQMREFVEDPANQGYFLAARSMNPDLDNTGLAQAAFGLKAAETQRKAVIANADLEVTERMSSALASLNSANQATMGLIKEKARTGQNITQEELQRGRAAYTAEYTQIRQELASSGASPDVLKPFDDQYNVAMKAMDSFDKITNQSIATAEKNDFIASIQTFVIGNEDLSNTEKLGALSLIDARLDELMTTGALTTDGLENILNAFAFETPVDKGQQDSTQVLTDKPDDIFQSDLLDEIKSRDSSPQETWKNATSLVNYLDGAREPTLLAESLGYLSHTYFKLGDKDNQFVSGETAATTTEAITKALTRLGAENPAAAATEANRMSTAFDRMRAQANGAIRSMMARNSLTVENGRVTLDVEAFLKDSGLSFKEQEFILEYAKKNYGGDLQAMSEFRGRAAADAFKLGAARGKGQRTLRKFFKAADAQTTLRGDLQNLIDAEAALKAGSEAFDAKAAEFDTTPVADDNLEGGQGEDTLGAGFEGNAISLIEEFEGFRNNAYWDVNAYRTGWGSDTVTKRDGSVVKVTKDTVVSKEDADRDLARRSQEFAEAARNKIGAEVWDNTPGNVTAALTSIAYNYGSIPDRILDEARAGDWEALAVAVEGLADDNKGVNRRRRMREASIIRGRATAPAGRGPAYTPPPVSAEEMSLVSRAKAAEGSESGSSSPQERVLDVPEVQAVIEEMASSGRIRGAELQTLIAQLQRIAEGEADVQPE